VGKARARHGAKRISFRALAVAMCSCGLG
jgi:hypothetical protein